MVTPSRSHSVQKISPPSLPTSVALAVWPNGLLSPWDVPHSSFPPVAVLASLSLVHALGVVRLSFCGPNAGQVSRVLPAPRTRTAPPAGMLNLAPRWMVLLVFLVVSRLFPLSSLRGHSWTLSADPAPPQPSPHSALRPATSLVRRQARSDEVLVSSLLLQGFRPPQVLGIIGTEAVDRNLSAFRLKASLFLRVLTLSQWGALGRRLRPSDLTPLVFGAFLLPGSR